MVPGYVGTVCCTTVRYSAEALKLFSFDLCI